MLNEVKHLIASHSDFIEMVRFAHHDMVFTESRTLECKEMQGNTLKRVVGNVF